jgi:hypothetical protein
MSGAQGPVITGTEARGSLTRRRRWTHLPGEPPRGPGGSRRVGGRYAHASGGKRADLGGLYVRSRAEANYLRLLRFIGVPYHYEPKTFVFEAVRGGVNRTYTPDVYLPQADEFHEIKCWMDRDSRVKLRRMARDYPDVKIVVIGPEFFRSCEAQGLCRVIAGWECRHTVR